MIVRVLSVACSKMLQGGDLEWVKVACVRLEVEMGEGGGMLEYRSGGGRARIPCWCNLLGVCVEM